MRSKDQAKILAAAIYQAMQDKQEQQLEKIVENFCGHLKQKGLIRMIPAVLWELEKIYYIDKGMVAAKIIYKNEMNRHGLKEITNLIKSKTGKQVVAKEELDENILGGGIIRYEDKIIDFTLNSQIKKLAKQLSN